MISPLNAPEGAAVLPLVGLEADNLLAFVALLGLLRALEIARPTWRPRASWRGSPWIAHLHVAESADETRVAQAASEGIARLAEFLDVDGRSNVDFDRGGYRGYVERIRQNSTTLALASALTAEMPQKKSGGLQAAPLVMMFGQGHQNFLERIVDIARGKLPKSLAKLKSPPDLNDPRKIAEALFDQWRRVDETPAFRWDPDENQRYAWQYGDPSAAGAAPTVHGANRLAAIGFLSFATAPGERNMGVVGASRDNKGWSFVWPIWFAPLSREAVETLLAHPAVANGEHETVAALGVIEVLGARRIANGKFMNVARAAATSRQVKREGDARWTQYPNRNVFAPDGKRKDID